MRNKVLIILPLIIVSIPISIFFSFVIDNYLTKKAFSIESISLNKILINIGNNINLIKLFFMIQLLIIVFILLFTILKKDNEFKSENVRITNNISTPKKVGQGQHGTSRWLTSKEFENTFSKNILDLYKDISSNIFNSGGLVVGYEKKKDKEYIYYINENTHSITIGATRSGKTRTIVLQTIGNLGFAGESMIISDPKGEIFEFTSEFLESIGYEIVVIDFKDPLKSNKYNFLQPVIDAVNNNDYRKAEEYAWDITTSLVGSEDSKMEKIWRDGEMSIIAGSIMTVVYENKDRPEVQNLTNVYSFISEMCLSDYGDMPINRYIEDLDDNHPAKKIFNIARIAPEKTRGSFFTSALTTLKLFTSESINNMTCRSDFNIKDTGKIKRAIYIILPDERITYYSLASLFVNQQYVSLVEVADMRGGELENRVNFMLDEFGNFTTIPGFSNMLTVGGGRKIRFNIFLQSFSQLESKYSKEIASNILDNCQTWIYLKTANIDTANKIMRKLGNYTTSSYSKSNSYGKNDNGSSSKSMNLISRALLTEDEILRIERPYVLIINAGNYPAIKMIPDLSKWHFNKLFGLGDVDFNRKVREERKNKRRINESEKIQLWGIWKEYK
ncbi:MAG: type IV secretory system conjugative DNA transfer family protein [Clostridia bacterium]|nr:type IV secretory system conjugative DNA transfer family protein [Clostridia bacterium]